MNIKQLVSILLLLVLPQLVLANIKLNALFSDHMVVQRNAEIPVWGWADVNEKVIVVTSWGEKAEVITAKDGTWKVNIKTPDAGGPHKITVSGKNTIEIQDILSGEVWLCTGQSNMDWAMNKFVNNSKDYFHQPLVEYIKTEIATANDNWLRHIEVPRATSLHEKNENFKGNWISVKPEHTGKITATGYFFAKELREKLNVPIGLLECSWGGTRVQPWISEAAYKEDENLKEYFLACRSDAKKDIATITNPSYVDTDYEKKLKVWNEKGGKGRKPRPTISDPRTNMQEPATLHNAMVSAIVPYAIKGAIWYQGESNAVYLPEQYETFFTKMINSWRAEWNQGDFPFYWVQLAACNRGSKEADLGWATVNDHLRRTLKLPNTGMAVLYDIGEPRDIHPHNKIDVGKRLALWALKYDYDLVIPVVSGPLYKHKTIKGDKIEIEFESEGSGLMVGKKVLLNETYEIDKPLKWFEIMGENNIWQPAQAKITADNKIEVWNSEVSNPTHVRYAWSGNPDGANLYNKEGLPAAVFTTE
ncbi:sialate O-acetylesterase [Seonamhaeicola sp. MEBiC1930]|uniref:sialate O-acetylesterase n=1 Tax=Seonamhaeicola sp. MEBiC01930 TaxID=2976768 RepID=UPI0032511DD3